MSEFEYFGCVLDELGTDVFEYSRKVASGRKVVSVITSLVNAMGLQLECAIFLHESLLVPVFMYGSETLICLGLGLYKWTASEICWILGE